MNQRLINELNVPSPIGPGKGPQQRLVQEYLALNGYGLQIDGDWGVATSAVLERFQPGAKFVNQLLMNRLAAKLVGCASYSSPQETFRARVLDIARVYLSAHPIEIGGQNNGPWVRLFMNGIVGTKAPWCAGFATLVYQQARGVLSVPSPIGRTFSCDVLGMEGIAKKHLVPGTSDTVQAGDLFLVRHKVNKNDWIHTGIVTHVDAETFQTIEGNTNDSGSAEGFEVCARTRARKSVDVVTF